MARSPATSANEAALGAGIAGAAEAMPNRQEGQRLVDKVTQSPLRRRAGARHPRDAAPPSGLIDEAVRVFLALGITATDLRVRARPGSALATLAEAMDSPAGAR